MAPTPPSLRFTARNILSSIALTPREEPATPNILGSMKTEPITVDSGSIAAFVVLGVITLTVFFGAIYLMTCWHSGCCCCGRRGRKSKSRSKSKATSSVSNPVEKDVESQLSSDGDSSQSEERRGPRLLFGKKKNKLMRASRKEQLGQSEKFAGLAQERETTGTPMSEKQLLGKGHRSSSSVTVQKPEAIFSREREDCMTPMTLSTEGEDETTFGRISPSDRIA